MNRYARDKRPNVKPVEKVELSERHARWRFAAAVFLLAFGVAALIYAFMSFLSGDPGWREIEASATKENCGGEFAFLYDLGASGLSARTENRALTQLYSEASEKAYQIFNSDLEFDGVANVRTINSHPNEEIEIDEALYRAFSLLEEYVNRCIYLGPLYTLYDDMFYCNDDAEAAYYDPRQNDDIRAEFAQIASYANDPETIELRLLGENRVCLKVSDEYLKFAEEDGLDRFIDFFWMKNAFITDYLAETMIANGYTKGSISSYDGFVRALDGSTEYSFNLYDWREQGPYMAGVMHYSDARSIVYLRNYKMNDLDIQHYYEFADGERRTSYVDIADGLCRSSLDNLVSYSQEKGCAEVLLSMIPAYITDEFHEEEVDALTAEEIYSVWFQDGELCANDSKIMLEKK